MMLKVAVFVFALLCVSAESDEVIPPLLVTVGKMGFDNGRTLYDAYSMYSDAVQKMDDGHKLSDGLKLLKRVGDDLSADLINYNKDMNSLLMEKPSLLSKSKQVDLRWLKKYYKRGRIYYVPLVRRVCKGLFPNSGRRQGPLGGAFSLWDDIENNAYITRSSASTREKIGKTQVAVRKMVTARKRMHVLYAHLFHYLGQEATLQKVTLSSKVSKIVQSYASLVPKKPKDKKEVKPKAQQQKAPSVPKSASPKQHKATTSSVHTSSLKDSQSISTESRVNAVLQGK